MKLDLCMGVSSNFLIFTRKSRSCRGRRHLVWDGASACEGAVSHKY